MVACFVGVTLLSSCEDEFTEQDAFEQALALSNKREAEKAKQDSIAKAEENKKDSIAKAELKMKDSVTVNLRVLSFPTNVPLAGVNVSVTQNSLITKQSKPDGVVSIRMLKSNAELVLKANDHATVQFLYNYSVSGNQSILFATVKMPKTKDDAFFTVSGTANAEFDLTKSALYSPVPAGVQIKASVQSNLAGVVNAQADPAITNIILSDLPVWDVTSTTNENGKYELKIPAITGAFYTYKIEFGDFNANQRLAINRFLDASEVPGQHSLFGDFNLVSVPTLFTAREVTGYNSYGGTSYTMIPANVPTFKVEVAEDPSFGTKPVYTAMLVSNPSESYYNNLPLGRLFQFVKVSNYDNAVYPSNGVINFNIKDIRDGSVTTTEMNYYSYNGALPSSIQLSSNPYYYNSAQSPEKVFEGGKNVTDYIVTPSSQYYNYIGFTTANSYFSSGQYFVRTPRNFNLVPSGLNANFISLNFDYSTLRYYVAISGSGGQSATLDFSYGTGIKSRPVE